MSLWRLTRKLWHFRREGWTLVWHMAGCQLCLSARESWGRELPGCTQGNLLSRRLLAAWEARYGPVDRP